MKRIKYMLVKSIYKKNIILIGVVSLILLFSILILKLTQGKPSQKTQDIKSIPVNVKVVNLQKFKPEYTFYGHIAGTNEIDLIANLDGKIKIVSKKIFDSSRVKKNEILFELDPFEYQQDVVEKRAILNDLKIELNKTNFLMMESKKQLTIAKQDYERKKKLLGNTVSKKALDDSSLNLSKAKTNYSNEEFNINSIKENIEKAKSQLEISKKNLANTKYRAPFQGKIANNTIDIGSEIIRGRLLAKLVNTEILEVKFFVGETAFTELGTIEDIKGKNIRVFWNKSRYKNKYSATITRIDSVIDQQSAGLNMYAVLERIEDDDPIRPGAFVEITVEGKEITKSFLLPETAIYEESYVYILENGKPSKVEVKIRGNIKNNTLITGNLKNNDKVITTRLNNIREVQKLYNYK
ncbi:MAG: hypothetical protein CMP24_07520 [Rickettsiales bacterium]|nr:hypothetical protein [Rickettsiales bacterium]